MVVVSGWMDEAEDDKRTMGVVPSEMGLKVLYVHLILMDRRFVLRVRLCLM